MFCSEVTAHLLTFFVHIRNINMHMYITSAHGHELSGSVHADAYNLIYYALYYYAPWLWPVLCMVHERRVILNVFHTRLVYS